MTIWKSVGVSRYRGDVFGVEQFMEAGAARQVLALIAFIATLPGCRRLTVNEGRRTRARQRTLRARFEAFLRGGPWAPLAAVLYTSRHDEEKHGNAGDLGGPNGEALNAAEIAAIKKYGPDFGVHFVGLTFTPPEPWHVEGDGVTPIPHYALASLDATPITQEDELNDGEKSQLASAFRDAASAMLAAQAAAADTAEIRRQVDGLFQAVFTGGVDMPDKDGNKVGRSIGQSLADLRIIGESTNARLFVQQPDDAKAGRPSLADQVRNVYDGLFKSGTSIPNGNLVSMLGRLLKKTGA